MSSGDLRSYLYLKKLLSLTDLREHGFEQVRESIHDLITELYPTGGVFNPPVNLSGTQVDSVTVAPTQGISKGLMIDIPIQVSKFENQAGIPYHVAFRAQAVLDPFYRESCLETGQVEFSKERELVGEKAAPNAVTVSGSGLRFVVDSVFEVGISSAGRHVRVWKADPVSETDCYEDLTVQWGSGENFVVTTGRFGQGVPSLVAADYLVLAEGPTIRRNTDLRLSTGYCYIGFVTGSGAGTTPSVFNITDQKSLLVDFSLLEHITRLHTNGRLKIDVKSVAGEVGVTQIRVQSPAGVVKFTVDENGNTVVQGNVDIKGNLDVVGTTTEHNTETVYHDEIVTGNFSAGDSDADAHNIKGTWDHKSGGVTKFNVHGASGRVGIGGMPDASAALKVTGDQVNVGNVLPDQDILRDLGSPSKRWLNAYVQNMVFTGDFLPLVDNLTDIGSAALRWAEGYFGTLLRIGTGQVQFSPSGATINPTGNATFSPGGSLVVAPGTTLDFTPGGAMTLNPTGNLTAYKTFRVSADNSIDLGAAGVRWRYAHIAAFPQALQPSADASFDVGGVGTRWASLFLSGNVNAGGNAVIGGFATVGSYLTVASYLGSPAGSLTLRGTTNIVFQSTGANNRWQIDASGHLLPMSNGSFDLGSSGMRVRSGYMNDTYTNNVYLGFSTAHYLSYNGGSPRLGTAGSLFFAAGSADRWIIETGGVLRPNVNGYQLGTTAQRASIFATAVDNSGNDIAAGRQQGSYFAPTYGNYTPPDSNPEAYTRWNANICSCYGNANGSFGRAYNVASVTHTIGTGIYQVNFKYALALVYTCLVTAVNSSGSVNGSCVSQANGSVTIAFRTIGNVATDCDYGLLLVGQRL